MNPAPFPILTWLEGKGTRPHLGLAFLLRHIFENADRFRYSSEIIEELELAPSTTAAWFRKKRLAPIRYWLAAARALDLTRAIAAEPYRSLNEIAQKRGFSDHSGASWMLERAFGVTAGAVREGLDEAWLMDQWWERTTAKRRRAKAGAR